VAERAPTSKSSTRAPWTASGKLQARRESTAFSKEMSVIFGGVSEAVSFWSSMISSRLQETANNTEK